VLRIADDGPVDAHVVRVLDALEQARRAE